MSFSPLRDSYTELAAKFSLHRVFAVSNERYSLYPRVHTPHGRLGRRISPLFVVSARPHSSQLSVPPWCLRFIFCRTKIPPESSSKWSPHYTRNFAMLIMRPSSLGGGRILRRILSVRLSVCPSVCPSVPLSLPSVTSRHLANYNDTHVFFGTHWGPHIVRPSRSHKFLFPLRRSTYHRMAFGVAT